MPLYETDMRVHDRHDYYGGHIYRQFVFASTIGDEKNGMGPRRKAAQTLYNLRVLDHDTFAADKYTMPVTGADMQTELEERELMNIILGQCTEQNLQGETLGKDSRYNIKCYNLPSGLWVYDVYRSNKDKQIVITAHKLNEEETSLLSEFATKNYTHACLTISFNAGNILDRRTCVMSIHTPEEGYVFMSQNDCHCGLTTVILNKKEEYSYADSIIERNYSSTE